MRPIIFRGKKVDNGTWAYGYYVFQPQRRGICGQIIPERDRDRHYVISPLRGSIEINPATIGQFTGLFDKKGKNIYEGDIIRAVGNNSAALTYIGAVVYGEGAFFIEEQNAFGPKLHSFKKTVMYNDMQASAEIEYTFEVIGNVHDNPELWKEEKE